MACRGRDRSVSPGSRTVRPACYSRRDATCGRQSQLRCEDTRTQPSNPPHEAAEHGLFRGLDLAKRGIGLREPMSKAAQTGIALRNERIGNFPRRPWPPLAGLLLVLPLLLGGVCCTTNVEAHSAAESVCPCHVGLSNPFRSSGLSRLPVTHAERLSRSPNSPRQRHSPATSDALAALERCVVLRRLLL